MAKRHPNHRLVKLHRSYTVEEVAVMLGAHRNTVRHWLKNGLDVVDQRRPALILGTVLVTFLKDRRQSGKRPCKPGEIYCLRCREPRRPADDIVHYRPLNPDRGDLVGNCSACAAALYRRTSLVTLAQAAGDLQVWMPQAGEHIGNTA